MVARRDLRWSPCRIRRCKIATLRERNSPKQLQGGGVVRVDCQGISVGLQGGAHLPLCLTCHAPVDQHPRAQRDLRVIFHLVTWLLRAGAQGSLCNIIRTATPFRNRRVRRGRIFRICRAFGGSVGGVFFLLEDITRYKVGLVGGIFDKKMEYGGVL